jgi:MoaE-MoaD fusion protein
MQVRILFFGMMKDIAGAINGSVDLREGATVADLLALCEARTPRLKEVLPSIAVAVNQKYAPVETELRDGDEVALLPPVSGGSGNSLAEDQKKENGRIVKIVRETIDTAQIVAELKHGGDGAVVVFEGIVRDQTRGRQTTHLEYEAYEEMALQEMESLAAQALRQFKIRDVALVHRLGRLEIGEISVLIVVVSAHRAAAFDACRWLIDTLKRTVPIWKKEYFVDGAVWAEGEPFPAEIPRAEATADSSSNSGGNPPGRGSPTAGSASK